MEHKKDQPSIDLVVSPMPPDRIFRVAEECLIGIRLVESRCAAGKWLYEYEMTGETGKVEKFQKRILELEVR